MVAGINDFFKDLEEDFKDNKVTPSTEELVLYFLFEKGLTLKDMAELPLPYIYGLLKVKTYIIKEEEKNARKQNNGRKTS